MIAPIRSARRRRTGILPFLAAMMLTLAALAALLGPVPAAEGEGGGGPAAPSEGDFDTVVEAVIRDHVRPVHEHFANATELLVEAVDHFCGAPDPSGLEGVRRTFESVARAYSALQPSGFGPIREANRAERLAFWPDPRGIGMKQVQALLAAADPAALDPAVLKGKSVGVQGLTALEFVLYGPPAPTLLEKDAFACRYAAAVARNVGDIAGELVEAWQPDGDATALLRDPGPDNPVFRTSGEVVGEIFGTVATALEDISDRKIRVLIGSEAARAKPKQTLFWRSGQTMPGVASGLEAASHLVEVSGIADLMEPAEEWLPRSIRFELGKTAETAGRVVLPVEEIPADASARSAATYVMVATDALKDAVGGDLLLAVGLARGFNSLDGD